MYRFQTAAVALFASQIILLIILIMFLSCRLFSLLSRQVFKDAQGSLDMDGKFSPLHRQDSNKISTDDIIKLLADIRKWVIGNYFGTCFYFKHLCACLWLFTSRVHTMHCWILINQKHFFVVSSCQTWEEQASDHPWTTECHHWMCPTWLLKYVTSSSSVL